MLDENLRHSFLVNISQYVYNKDSYTGNNLPLISPRFLEAHIYVVYLGWLQCLVHFVHTTPTSITLNTSFFKTVNTNSRKIFETVIFFPERSKNSSKKANIILFNISRSFRPFYDNVFQKTSEGYRRFPKTNEEVQPLPKMSKEPSNHITGLSSETANIKKLANLTANTKNYGQITLNAKPHSDALYTLQIEVSPPVIKPYLLLLFSRSLYIYFSFWKRKELARQKKKTVPPITTSVYPWSKATVVK